MISRDIEVLNEVKDIHFMLQKMTSKQAMQAGILIHQTEFDGLVAQNKQPSFCMVYKDNKFESILSPEARVVYRDYLEEETEKKKVIGKILAGVLQ
jgi:hypothetical protein